MELCKADTESKDIWQTFNCFHNTRWILLLCWIPGCNRVSAEGFQPHSFSFLITKGSNATDGLFSRRNSKDSVLDFQPSHSRQFRHCTETRLRNSIHAKVSRIVRCDRCTIAIGNNGFAFVDFRQSETHTPNDLQWPGNGVSNRTLSCRTGEATNLKILFYRVHEISTTSLGYPHETKRSMV